MTRLIGGFRTPRLIVKEWHSLTSDEWEQEDLAVVVVELLSPSVTRSLPAAWQGEYTRERAGAWIEERDQEGTTLLAISNIDRKPIGLMILSESDEGGTDASEIRLGYLLAERAWGKGYATEMVEGFVRLCRAQESISGITAGVERANRSSRNVLEKNHFQLVPPSASGDSGEDNGELMYHLNVR
jgi:RimJ/RimL family protein N-acetyltransferase